MSIGVCVRQQEEASKLGVLEDLGRLALFSFSMQGCGGWG